MQIIRAPRPETGYTTIRNDVLRDTKLSFRARGVLAYLLSHSDNWRTDAESMAAVASEGRQAIQTALKELKVAGYIETRKSQDALGRWTTTTIVYDTPADIRKTLDTTVVKTTKKDRVDNATNTASRIVNVVWEPNAKNNVQPPVAVVKIVANALRNGVSERKLTRALIAIAAAGETVTNYRLNKVLNGAPAKKGTIQADMKTDWSKESTVL
jgi:hypothetical protein